MPNPNFQSYDGDGSNDELLILVMVAVKKNVNVNVKSVGVLKAVVSKDKFVGKPKHMVLFN